MVHPNVEIHLAFPSRLSTSPSSTRAPPDGHVASAMRYSPTTGRFGAKWKTEFPLDCLHYCYPGPADYWALALYNLMLNNPRFRAL